MNDSFQSCCFHHSTEAHNYSSDTAIKTKKRFKVFQATSKQTADSERTRLPLADLKQMFPVLSMVQRKAAIHDSGSSS